MTETKKRLHPMKRLRTVSSREMRKLERHLERRARGRAAAAELALRRSGEKLEGLWKDIASVREYLAMTHALNEGGRLTEDEYFFHCVAPVESLEEHVSMQGDYRTKLDGILAKMTEIEASHGLKPGESWRRGQGPAEFKRLSALYEKTRDNAFAKLLREAGLSAHARLWREDREEFNRLREAGRAALFDRWDIESATMKLIELYGSEASKSAGAKAYYAATVMLGSASEALLLLKCIQEPGEVAAARAALPRGARFHKDGPLYWNLNQLIEISKQAGWISDVEMEDVRIHIVNLVAEFHTRGTWSTRGAMPSTSPTPRSGRSNMMMLTPLT